MDMKPVKGPDTKKVKDPDMKPAKNPDTKKARTTVRKMQESLSFATFDLKKVH